jgi:hypothetical protein
MVDRHRVVPDAAPLGLLGVYEIVDGYRYAGPTGLKTTAPCPAALRSIVYCDASGQRPNP